MQTIKIFIVLTALLLVQSEDNLRKINLNGEAGVGCIQYISGGLYNFEQLALDTSDYNATVGTDNLYFDVCSYATTKCPGDSTDSFAVRITSDTGTTDCKHLSGSHVADIDFARADKDNVTSGVTLNFTGGEKDTTSGNLWGLELTLQCDETVEKLNVTSATKVGTIYKVTAISKSGCAQVNFVEIWKFIEDNKYVFTIILAVTGFFLCLFGREFIKTTLFISGFLITAGVILAVVFGYFITSDTENWVKWTVLGCASVVGIIVGYGLMQDTARKIGTCVIGALLGYVLGELAYNTLVVRLITDDSYTQTVMIATIVVSALVLAAVGFFASDFFQIIGTASFGSFVVFRSAGLLFGGYPTYDQLQKEIHNKQYENVPVEFYLYLGGTVVLAIIGIIFQYKQKRKREHDKQDENQRLVYKNSFHGDSNTNYQGLH